MKYAFTFLMLLALCSACLAQTGRPLMHLAVGQTYYLNSTGSSVVMQSVGGRQDKVDVTLNFRMAFTVTGIKDSVYTMQARYEALEMKIRLADTTIMMGAEPKSKLDTPSAIIARMINKPFSVTLSNSGRVRSVEKLDDLITAAFDVFPALGGAKKEEIRSRFVQSFGENAFKGSIELGLAVLPAATISKNYKWAVNNFQQMPAPLKVHTMYQLIDLNDTFYQVHGEGSLATDSTVKPADVNGLMVKYNIDGTTLTDVKIDRKTGWVMELQLKQLMEGNMLILDNAKMPDGKTIPVFFTTGLAATGGKKP